MSNSNHKTGNVDADAKWPKTFPPLTPEQEQISDDFVKHWHDVLPRKYGIVDNFNHRYVVRNAPAGFVRTLEIGCGSGEHLEYEHLTSEQEENYFAVDIRENMVAAFKQRFPRIQAVVGDCQKPMAFADGYFDRILAIHVLEHLPDLPAAAKELRRLCTSSGTLSVVVPCEGSAAYALARKISAKRIFEKRYRQSYRWFIEREHVNIPNEIFEELGRYFEVTASSYFPFPIKAEFCNLCIGATLRPSKV